MASTAEEQKDAAPSNDRKRKLEQELQEGLATFKTRQQRFVQLLDAIEQDPEWKWKPDKIKVRELRLLWCTHEFVEVGDLEVDENGRYTDCKKTLPPTDDVKVALKWLADRIAPYSTDEAKELEEKLRTHFHWNDVDKLSAMYEVARKYSGLRVKKVESVLIHDRVTFEIDGVPSNPVAIVKMDQELDGPRVTWESFPPISFLIRK